MEALIYLDTHVPVWLYAGRLDLLSEHAKELIDEEDLVISPMVTLELEYLHEIGRLTVGGNAIAQSLQAQIGLHTCDLPFPRIIESALDQHWTRDPFDRLIVGHASVSGSVLVTGDETIRRHYPRAQW